MTNPKSRIFAAVAGALSLSAAVAWAETPTQDQKIRELEAKVAALEAKQAANSKDMAATIDAVLRDAEKRSQLLATSGDMGAGYDNGFYIRAGDAWVLRPGAALQFRYVTNFRDSVGGGDDSDIEDGFEISRMKFELGGTAFTPELEYFFEWNSDDSTGNLSLEDAWAKYMFADEWGTRAGQFKDPVSHEWLVSYKRQLAVDRSMLNEVLGGGFLGRTQGVSLIYGGYNRNNPLNVEVAFTDGANQLNTTFVDRDFNFGLAGRVEYKFTGDWRSYRDFSAMGNKEDLFVLGAGGDWSQQGDGNVLTGTIDAQFETAAGLGIYGGVLVRNVDEELTGLGDSITDWGVVAQVGYMLNPAWEIFGRYDVIKFDVEPVADEDTFHELTIGVNYFLGTNGSAGHRAKITVDLTYLPNGAPAALEEIDVLDNNGAEAEWMLRAQFQLLI